jgi:diadenosine tetraphosphatase ApaH/serine/threonine PP2A family protein phosphatase
MKYAILGDIHANLLALRAAIEDAEQRGARKFLSVGDIVGYGAAPRECIALLRETGAIAVKGNHDAAATGDLELGMFNPHARAAIVWTRATLTRDELQWLSMLPLTLDLTECSVSHGTYHRPELFDYLLAESDADASFHVLPTPVCFVGHTHVPMAFVRLCDDPFRTSRMEGPAFPLGEVSKALVNVGSVGQPRDDDPRAPYALFDSQAQLVEIRRVAYDVEREGARIRSAGLPAVLAERLRLGV